jgi:hypothetical protein
MSLSYSGYKDLNDYICDKKQVLDITKSPGFRL